MNVPAARAMVRRGKRHMMRLLAAALWLPLAAWLAGCASGLPARERVPLQWALAPAHDGALGAFAQPSQPSKLAPPPSGNGATRVQPLVEAALALDARLALIRNAKSSIDLQTYYLGDDATGALVLRELQQAARRGVRVRLLVDDFHTAGRDPWLLSLEAEPFAHVRLFNPFFGRPRNVAQRLLELAASFSRLTHRMHNKLMVADGVVAIVGGRNVADEYFLRSREANFIDLEALVGGALVADLQAIFDAYWNSDLVYGVEQVTGAAAAASARPIGAEREEAGDAKTALAPQPGAWVSAQIEGRAPLRWLAADAGAVADPPDRRPGATPADRITSRARMHQLVEAAQESYDLVTPYFIPDAAALAQIDRLRARGVQVTIATNGMADTDEPVVNAVYNRFRQDLLARGVRLFEVSARQIGRSRSLRQRFGDSKGRLHAKLAIIDRKTVLLGSVNFDPRSARLNTELGVRLQSAALAQQLRDALHMDESEGVYEVVLDAKTQTLRWVSNGPEREVLDEEPNVGLLLRLRMLWLSWLVPLDQL